MVKVVNAFILSIFFLSLLTTGVSAIHNIDGTPVNYLISDDSTGGDCTLIGTWDAATKTCTLTTDISSYEYGVTEIMIKSAGVTLNGNGHMMYSPGPWWGQWGIALVNSSITVKNLKMTGWGTPIVPTALPLYSYYVGNNKIINNTITNSVYGISLWSADNLVEGNVVDNFYRAIVVNYGDQTIRNNNIINSDIGISVGKDRVSNNKIYNNNFINNIYNINDGSGYGDLVGWGVNNVLNLAKPIGGNYYSGFSTPAQGCSDGDDDGFCDAPYAPVLPKSVAGIQDNLPWTQANGWLHIPPMTTISLSGTLGNDGWYISDVLVTLTAVDYDYNSGSMVRKTEYSSDGLSWNVYTAPFTLDTDGTKKIYYRSIDTMGNIETTKSQILNIDKTAPEITITAPMDTAYLLNQDVLAGWLATDTLSGIDVIEATTAVGQPIDTSTVGTKTFTVTATDLAGNSKTSTVSYDVLWYSGVLQPINTDGSSIFKLGSTIPVKFQLKDANGDYVRTAVARLYLAKKLTSGWDEEMDATSASAATTDNSFRYDCITEQYIFNLGTKTLETGIWQIRIKLDDSTADSVEILLK